MPTQAATAAPIPNRSWSRQAWAAAAIALSAALLAAAAPGIGGWPALAFLAFGPWLASLSTLGLRAAAASGLLMGFAYIIPGRWNSFASALQANSVEGLQQIGLMLLFFVGFALPFAVFGALDAWRRRTALSPHAAALWRAAVLSSLVCGLWSPFAYSPAGFLVGFAPLLPLAAWLGEVLLLMLVLWPAAAIAELLTGPRRPHWPVLAGPLLALLAAAGYGQPRIEALARQQANGEGLALSALMLQLDLPHRSAARLLDRDRRGAPRSALELSRAGLAAAPHCELVVWPETPVQPDDLAQVCDRGDSLAQSLGRPLLAQCYRAGSTGRLISAEWFEGLAAERAWHAKSVLVPFYEQPLWGERPVQAGAPGAVFRLDGEHSLIPALCYELHAGPQLRQGVLAGGQFIVHMASFTPFARHPVDRWDLGMAQIRAAEYGRPILRAANRGAIGWIDALGRPQQLSERFGAAADCLEVWSPAAPPTPYARIGPLAAWLPGLIALLALLAISLVARKRLASQSRGTPS